jgi:hypothetical protein
MLRLQVYPTPAIASDAGRSLGEFYWHTSWTLRLMIEGQLPAMVSLTFGIQADNKPENEDCRMRATEPVSEL